MVLSLKKPFLKYWWILIKNLLLCYITFRIETLFYTLITNRFLSIFQNFIRVFKTFCFFLVWHCYILWYEIIDGKRAKVCLEFEGEKEFLLLHCWNDNQSFQMKYRIIKIVLNSACIGNRRRRLPKIEFFWFNSKLLVESITAPVHFFWNSRRNQVGVEWAGFLEKTHSTNVP